MLDLDLAPPVSPARLAVRALIRTPESRVLALAGEAQLTPAELAAAQARARVLASSVRQARRGASGVDALMHEFALSSAEGVALMCLAEALLRVPDAATRDRLIADKLGHGDWASHVGHSPSLFVNATAWALLLTGFLGIGGLSRPRRAPSAPRPARQPA